MANNRIPPKTERRIKTTIVIPAHGEGRLLHYTLKSVVLSINYAKNHGIDTDIIIVADLIDDKTKRYLSLQKNVLLGVDFKIFNVSFGSSGKSRQYGISKSKSEYVGVIDGDDLMSLKWIVEAIKILQKKKHTVVHPEYVFGFGAKDSLWHMHSSQSEYFSHRGSVEHNYYCAMMMTTKQLANSVPYRDVRLEESFGYEDWLWNCDTLMAGVIHITAPKTMCAYRIKKQGSQFSLWENCLMPRTEYLLTKTPKEERLSIGTIQKNRKNIYLDKSRNIIDKLFNWLIKHVGKKIHPRLVEYLSSMRNETLHLFRSIEEPYSNLIPEWLIEETNKLHKIEPRVYFSKHLRSVIPLYIPSPTSFSDAYWDLLEKVGINNDYLFIVPYFKHGGAEKLISNYISAILSENPNASVAILTTENQSSPNKPINKKVKFVIPGTSYFELRIEDQARLISVFITQTRPRIVHLVSSVAGYMALERYGRALSKYSKFYISIFAIDRTDEGRDTHVFIDRVQDSMDYIEGIFTDNQAIVNRIVDLTAIDKGKFNVIYQPLLEKSLALTTTSKKFTNKPTKVLWAGRMDREKRPDILVKIAELSHKRNTELEFYAAGSPAFENTYYLEEILKSPYINYIGEFTGGLKSLPTNKFDIFLLTSEWEGLPNVMLEAIAEELLVVAPDVGGVSEVIMDTSHGYLVNGFDNIDGYVKALSSASINLDHSKQIIINSQALISKRHTNEQFLKSLKAVKGYLV